MTIQLTSYDIIRRPVITEKATDLSANNQVVFMVNKAANKTQIKSAVEEIFGVKVKAVNTINHPGKTRKFRGFDGKKNAFKKAVVSLEQGSAIDITSGVK